MVAAGMPTAGDPSLLKRRLQNLVTLCKDNKREFRSFPTLNYGASRLGKVM